MSTAELRKCLIDKILTDENEHLLIEAFRLLDVSLKDSDVYKVSGERK